MICNRLRSGQDAACAPLSGRNYQQMVLVNRADVQNKRIVTSYMTIGGEYVCRHRVYFDLKPGATGYLFRSGENGSIIFGSVKTEIKDEVMSYQHTVSGVLIGIDEAMKCLRTQMDSADVFAAIQYYDNSIEIYGFEYGLRMQPYSYEPSVTRGGTAITLASDPDVTENFLPLIYASQGDAVADFDNLFANNEFNTAGDFNDDFNDDFYNDI